MLTPATQGNGVAPAPGSCDSRTVPDIHLDPDIAAHYDEASADRFDPDVLDPTVDLLADLAGDGAALELAVGTGRVALPLAARGVAVTGIDLSAAMLEQLRAKPGADTVTVVEGDMTTTRAEGTYSLVYLVFNSIMNLTEQDLQVACFENAAAHLEVGGHFVVEVMVPALRRLPPGETHRVFGATDSYLGFDEYVDLPGQILRSHHYTRTGAGFVGHAAPYRFVWPAELDLMARLAGLHPVDRWEDWRRRPFTADSPQHVSVWRKR